MLGATLPVLMAPMMLLMEGAPPDGCWVVSVSASSIPAFAHASSSTPGFILGCWGTGVLRKLLTCLHNGLAAQGSPA